jgi:hypothetical protein
VHGNAEEVCIFNPLLSNGFSFNIANPYVVNRLFCNILR